MKIYVLQTRRLRNQLPDCSKLAINQKTDNDVTSFWHGVFIKAFWSAFVSLVNFSCWSKFQANIIAGSGAMIILFYKGLTRNLEIGNSPIWVFPISKDCSELEIPNLPQMFPIKCYKMLQNTIVTAFTASELLRENQQREVKFPPPPRLGLKTKYLVLLTQLILLILILK